MDRDDEPKSNGGWISHYGKRLDFDDRNKNGEPARPERSGQSESAAAAEAVTPIERTRDSASPEREIGAPRAAARPVPAPAKRKQHVVLWSFLIALGLVLAVAAGVLFYLWNGLRTPSASATIQVTIEKGMRARDVAETLETNGLIRNAFLFSGWMKLKDEGSGFQAGVYELTPGMTREEIVAKLNKGDTIAAATIRFTIPEGFTVAQIADRLAKAGFVDKEKFLTAAKTPSLWTGSVWSKTLPADQDLRYPLEGYLFPDTYEMKRGSTETDIINRMLSELDLKLDQLPEDWQSALEEREMTVHQLLTVASLVEREVVLDEERPMVASVIENRLKKKMPLQIDATIQYLLDKQKERLLEGDLKVESPYNTYLNAGLPPGPISSISLKSIEAVLYPEPSDNLYYVTKKDGSNGHLFAVTYKQHQKNIKTSEQNAQKSAK